MRNVYLSCFSHLCTAGRQSCASGVSNCFRFQSDKMYNHIYQCLTTAHWNHACMQYLAHTCHDTVSVIVFSVRWGSHINPHEDSSLLGWRRVDWQIFSDRGACCLHLHGLRSRDSSWTANSENGGSKLTRGFINYVPIDMASYPRRLESSKQLS